MNVNVGCINFVNRQQLWWLTIRQNVVKADASEGPLLCQMTKLLQTFWNVEVFPRRKRPRELGLHLPIGLNTFTLVISACPAFVLQNNFLLISTLTGSITFDGAINSGICVHWMINKGATMRYKCCAVSVAVALHILSGWTRSISCVGKQKNILKFRQKEFAVSLFTSKNKRLLENHDVH